MSRKAGSPRNVDCLVAGGGYVGLSTAVAIKAAAPHLNITIVDIAPKTAVEKELRASAIAAAACRMLEKLGVWDDMAKDAQPITRMIVTDSKTNDVVRPVFLTFGEEQDASDAGEPFAHMLPNKTMIKALRKRAATLGIEMIHEDSVDHFTKEAASMLINLGSGRVYNAKLLVAADGARSRLREQAGIKVVNWSYDQSGIVITVAHERPHHGVAEEHFLPAGPFAILPLKNNRSSLVWTESTKEAERLVAADDLTFELELERRFGHKLGKISVIGDRRAFPLGLRLSRSFVQERLALVGDAAHGVHPISGQGLNLGFKDAAALAETIVEADRLGLDIGSLAVLERYEKWRRYDTVQMGIVTDVLNRLFSNDNPVLRLARDMGLGMVEKMPGLKQRFINQAAGRSGGILEKMAGKPPRLLVGEAI